MLDWWKVEVDSGWWMVDGGTWLMEGGRWKVMIMDGQSWGRYRALRNVMEGGYHRWIELQWSLISGGQMVAIKWRVVDVGLNFSPEASKASNCRSWADDESAWLLVGCCPGLSCQTVECFRRTDACNNPCLRPCKKPKMSEHLHRLCRTLFRIDCLCNWGEAWHFQLGLPLDFPTWH